MSPGSSEQTMVALACVIVVYSAVITIVVISILSEKWPR